MKNLTPRSSSNVRPEAPMSNSADVRYANPVIRGDREQFLAPVHATIVDIENLLLGQHSHRMLLPSVGVPGPHHVVLVVLVSSGAKMCRIATGWIVAGVEDEEAVWDGSVRQFPRQPMREVVLEVCPKLSISTSVPATCPLPAVIPFPDIHSGPERFREGGGTNAASVTENMMEGFPLDPPLFRIGSWREICFLAAPAIAHAIAIGPGVIFTIIEIWVILRLHLNLQFNARPGASQRCRAFTCEDTIVPRMGGAA